MPTPPDLTVEPVPPCLGNADAVIPSGARGCFISRSASDIHPICAEVGFNLELQFVWSEPIPGGAGIKATCELSDDGDSDCPDLP